MAKGTIKWFDEAKGYGFIKQDDGKDIFVHHSVIKGQGFKSLSAGDKVFFDIVEQPDGKISAYNVTHCADDVACAKPSEPSGDLAGNYDSDGAGPHGSGGGIDDEPY